MASLNYNVIDALLLTSVAFIAVPLIVYLIRRLVVKPTYEPRSKSGASRMLIFSVCLFCSVWCLRYAVGYFGIMHPDFSSAVAESSVEGLTWWEEIINSMIHAFQTFSMDESYTEYIVNGKTMLRKIFGADSSWQTGYGIYASVLNFAAPIAGGAVIFEVLASIFPKIKLFASHFAFWKEKYYFSELNSASLILAKSIILSGNDPCLFRHIIKAIKRPVIVFTDAYIDDENEKSSELLLEAKLLGAISVRDDLSHVKKNRFGTKKFFLIDENESGNLQALTALANSNNSRYLRKAEIYLFTNDDAYVQVERSVCDKFRKDWNLSDDADELPAIIPVQSYRNLISNLLVEVPLYEPLISKKRKHGYPLDLTVSILGTGHIGTEMFLSTYWFGQILNCNLHINVLSQETEKEFWSKIDYINPEIRHTTIEGDEILTFNDKGNKSPVYCEVNYYPCDIRSSEFVESLLSNGENNILNTDYFFVALGSDEDNISVANTIKRFVGNYHIAVADKELREKGEKSSPNKAVVTYVVYDSEIADALNRKKQYRYVDGTVDVYMRAVGSICEVYSVQNVFDDKHKASAQNAHEAYASIHNTEKRAEDHKNRMKDAYKYWASLAQAKHKSYRVFASGVELPSMLDLEDNPDIIKKDKEAEKVYNAYQKAMENAEKQYCDIVSGSTKWANDEERVELLHKLAWMEHRRWNAFTRVKGFKSTKAYTAYHDSANSYKEMDVKLHPCLIECDKKGIRVACDSDRNIGIGPIFLRSDDADMDFLDKLSYDLRDKGYNDYDFKLYDYPMIEKTILNSIKLEGDFKEAATKTAKKIHEEWCKKQLAAGWSFGEKYDAEKKTDSRITEFEKLSKKDYKDAIYAPFTQYKIAYALGYSVKIR